MNESLSISVEDLRFTYPGGVEAITGVNLVIEPGETVALVGENGAGKTTLVRHFNGMLKPTTGRVQVGDWDTRDYSIAALARQVGYAFQNPDDQLFERTVSAEVAFGPRNLGFTPEAVTDAVQNALERVGLAEAARQHPYDLPLSQRRLLALAATLAMQTPIIVLDEPTTGQDAPSIARVGAIVDALRGEGRTVIAITHDLDFCAEHFPRVVVMAAGRILADGLSRDVLAQTETLAQAEVDPPQMLRLASSLGLDSVPLTPEEFIKAWEEKKH